MRRNRYVYTPRRSLIGARRSAGPRRVSLWVLAAPALLVLGVFLLSRAAADDSPPRRSSVADGTPTPAAGIQGPPPAAPAQPALGLEEAPRPTAFAAALVEAPCGAPLYGFNERLRLAPASLTKIATALVVVDRADLSEVVDVTVNGPELSLATDATVMGLAPGDRLTVQDLLYGMLLPSGNDAAIALAEHVGGSVPAFVDLMNQKAAELGLSETSFANPHGLDDPGLYSSAHDMALLGVELLRNPLLAKIVRTSVYQPAWNRPPVTNLNLLLKIYPDAIGIKTGFTDDAGQTIAAAAERDGRTLVAAVLHSEDLYVDAVDLLEWGFANTPPACDGVVVEPSGARSNP